MISDVTVLDALQAAEQRFKAVGIDTARLDARVLLGHVMGIEASHLLMHQDHRVENIASFEALLRRREAREPIAHIIGVRGFWDHDFTVSADVLVPRPDSETLIEAALAITDKDDRIRVLDLGTGSGCLILSILAKRPHATGVAVDVSAAALTVARANAERLGLSERVTFVEGDFSTAPTEPFDLILSNPPYIKTGDIPTLTPELQFEPVQALDGGTDGLGAYRLLAPLVDNRTAVNGTVIFEVGVHQANAVSDLLHRNGYANVRIQLDLAGIERCVIATQPKTDAP